MNSDKEWKIILTSSPTNLLDDWENEIIADALEEAWNIDSRIGWLGGDDGETVYVLTVAGPEKPHDPSDIYSWDYNLLDLLTEYATPYDDIGGPCSDSQRADMRKRIYNLREFAGKIIEIADRTET